MERGDGIDMMNDSSFLYGLIVGSFIVLFFLLLEAISDVRFEIYALSMVLVFMVVIYIRVGKRKDAKM